MATTPARRYAAPRHVAADDPLAAATWRAANRAAHLRPEQALALAILDQAVADLVPRSATDGEPVRARRWIEADEPRWPLSFVSICDLFGFDVPATRAAILGRAHTAVVDTFHRRRERAVAWWSGQPQREWGSAELAAALGCEAPQARGLVAWGVRVGMLESVRRTGWGTVGVYRVRRAA